MLHLCKSRFLLLKSKKLFAPTFEAESKKRPHPTEAVTAFPLGEGVGTADGRGHYPSGKVSAQPTEEVTAFPLGEGVAQPTEEVTAFPFGEGVGTADERGYYPTRKVSA